MSFKLKKAIKDYWHSLNLENLIAAALLSVAVYNLSTAIEGCNTGTNDSVIPKHTVAETWSKFKPLAKPGYEINTSLDIEVREALKPYVASLLENSSAAEPVPASKIGEQVAFLDITKDLTYVGNGQVRSTYQYSQALLLPMQSEKNRYFFVTANHCVDEPRSASVERALVVQNKVFYISDLIAFSKEADIAIGWCHGAEPADVKYIPFSGDCEQRGNIEIVPNEQQPKWPMVNGDMLDCNSSYLLTSAYVFGGYSGSPIVSGGRVTGFTIASTETAPNCSIGVSANNLKGMLEYFLAN